MKLCTRIITAVTNIERRRLIIRRLHEKGSARVDELSDELNVTRVTIRSDISDLEKRGLAVRSRGVIYAPEYGDLPRQVAKTIHERIEEKELISSLVAPMVEPGMTIILDAGSTNVVLAQSLHNKSITVVTNSVPVILELSADPEIDLIVSGGVLRKPSMSMVGEFSRGLYSHIHADIAFLGANGVSFEKGPSSPNLLEAETKRSIIKAADTVCLLVDSSKFGKTQMAQICGWDSISLIVTDSMSDELRDRFDEIGVKVLLPT